MAKMKELIPTNDMRPEDKVLSRKDAIAKATHPVKLCVLTDPSGNEVPGYQGVYDGQLRKVVSVVGNEYRLLPNKEVLLPILEHLDKTGWKFTFDQFSYVSDQRMRVHLTFPEFHVKDDAKGINLSLFIHNSYNNLESFKLMPGAMRLVCTNGMVIGMLFRKIKINHQATDIRQLAVANVDAVIGEFLSNGKKVEEWVRDMMSRPLTVDVVKKTARTFDTAISSTAYRSIGLLGDDEANGQVKEIAETITPADVKRHGAWQFYNTLTDFISHKTPQRYRVEYLSRVSPMFGL
jgi:hypothetical protein